MTPTSDCSGLSRWSCVFTRYAESQKALQLNNIAFSLFLLVRTRFPFLILLTFFLFLSYRAHGCASHRVLVHVTVRLRLRCWSDEESEWRKRGGDDEGRSLRVGTGVQG